MDSIRRFFVNFQKHGTISWSSDQKAKVGTDVENNMTKGIQNKDGVRSNNADKIQQKDSTENHKDFDNFEALQDPIKRINTGKNGPFDTKKNPTNTSECLEEFDEILKEINIDMNTEAVSLVDVDDVLTSLTEEDVTLNLETPRFDLHDLVQNFGLSFEDVDIEPTSIADFIEPTNLYEDIETINLDEIFIDDSDEDAAKENETLREDLLMSQDIFSLSSEDSQVYEPKVKPKGNKEIQEIKNVNLETETSVNDNDKITGKQNVSEVSQPNYPDVLFMYENNDPESKKRDDSMSQANEPKTITENDFDMKSQDIISINDSNDFEPNDIEFKNFDELQTISQSNEPKTITENDFNVKSQDIISINDSNDFEHNDIEFKDRDELENVQDKNLEHEIHEPNTKSEYDSDDCGYLSSDFEFITEDEAKLDGLIINFNPEVPSKTIKPKTVKTIEISVDQFSNKCNSSENTSHESSLEDSDLNYTTNNEYSSDLQRNDKDLNERGPNKTLNCDTRNEHNNVQKNLSIFESLRNFRRTSKNLEQNPSSNCLHLTQGLRRDYLDVSEHKNLQTVGPGFNFGPSTSQRQGNCTVPSNLEGNRQGLSDLTRNRPSNSGRNGRAPSVEENRPGPSGLGENWPHSGLNHQHHPSSLKGNRHGPSNVEGNRPGSRILSRNCSRTSHDIQRWRAFQQRRNRFVLDQTYRDNHWVLTDEEYYQLFNPNHLPLPNQSVRSENKSTLSTSTMLIEYDGIGFDMQMVRGCSESEDEEVKEEAAACARRILEMYPDENRKRRRRF